MTVAAGTLTAVNGVAEVVEAGTGTNFVRDTVFQGNDQAYTTYKYTYDENGNITEVKNAANESLYRYVYDDLSQLKWEYNTVLGEAYYFTYDNAGNILT